MMLEHVPRVENKRVDALANLATALMMPNDVTLNIPLVNNGLYIQLCLNVRK